MNPIKRMTLIGAVIVIIGIVALFGIYYSGKKLQARQEIRNSQQSAHQAAREEKSSNEEIPEVIPKATESAEPVLQEKVKSAEPLEPDIIGEEELLKYLKVKDKVFPIFDKKRGYSDLMLDQKTKWGQQIILQHMMTLGDMRLKKVAGLKNNELKESRYSSISNAIFEWVQRTKSLPYKRKYIGDESFFTSKLSKVVPCAENDNLFAKHKEEIGRTFMGDFELVDY